MGRRSFYTYAWLRGMAWNAFDTAKEQESGRNLHCMSAVVLCAFTLEGYLNHVGALRVRDWNTKKERKPWWKKLKLIGREFNTKFDKGRPPFQSMVEAFSFRDKLAHGKSIINEAFDGEHPSGQSAKGSYLHPEWLKEYQSLEKVETMLKEMDAALTQLQSAAGLEAEPLGLIAEGTSEGAAS